MGSDWLARPKKSCGIVEPAPVSVFRMKRSGPVELGTPVKLDAGGDVVAASPGDALVGKVVDMNRDGTVDVATGPFLHKPRWPAKNLRFNQIVHKSFVEQQVEDGSDGKPILHRVTACDVWLGVKSDGTWRDIRPFFDAEESPVTCFACLSC